MVGGFGLCGIPENLIAALVERGVKNLTVVSNNCGVDDWGLGLLLRAASRSARWCPPTSGENGEFERQFLSGELEVELVPQGTLAERMRAGGAGIPAFYTPAGAGTLVAEGKETRAVRRPRLPAGARHRGRLLAWSPRGRATGWATSCTASRPETSIPMAVTAGRIAIAEVEELVEVGSLDPECIHTPGVFVNRMVVAPRQKRIERRTVRKA